MAYLLVSCIHQRDIRCHQLRVEIDRIVAQLGFRDRFQTLTSLGQIRITLHPSIRVSPITDQGPPSLPEAIHVHGMP